MDVRPPLLVVLVVLAGVGISAVLFPAIGAFGGPPDVTTTADPAVDSATANSSQAQDVPPSLAVQVGSGHNEYLIQVGNDSPSNRTVSLTLTHEESDSSLLDRTETLAPNGTVRIELRAPADYLLEVTDDSTGTTGTHRVTPDEFDCNYRFATIRVDRNGTVDSRVIATVMGC